MSPLASCSRVTRIAADKCVLAKCLAKESNRSRECGSNASPPNKLNAVACDGDGRDKDIVIDADDALGSAGAATDALGSVGDLTEATDFAACAGDLTEATDFAACTGDCTGDDRFDAIELSVLAASVT